MKGNLIVLVAIVSAVCASAQRRGGGRGIAPGSDQYPPIPRSEPEKKILATIDAATKADELYENVPAADGRFLRMLTEAANAKHVVEIGTSTGLSGMWFCIPLEKTGGRLTTFEYERRPGGDREEEFQRCWRRAAGNGRRKAMLTRKSLID